MKGELDALDVEVTTLIEASPATVFRFLAQPERFGEWMEASVQLTPEVGADIRLDFADQKTVVCGRLLEVEPDKRIVFTWGVEKGRQAETIPLGSTTVSIDLAPEGSGTRVTLRHRGLPDEKERQDHHEGWIYHLNILDRLATT